MWLEFYEDYYESHPKECMLVEGGEDVQFVTGDKEIDDIERRINSGEMTDADLVRELEGWEKEKPGSVEAPPISEEDLDFEDAYG